MVILEAAGLQKEFDGNPPLFEDVSFKISEGDRIGLVGVNGAGKSTLLRLITGEERPDAGSMRRDPLLSLGYMAQLKADDGRTLLSELLTVFQHLIDAERELERIAADIGRGGDAAALVRRQEQLMESYERDGGYLYVSRAKSMLRGLGFEESEFQDPVSRLSGGQRTRLELAKVLLRDFNLILLDEPTNHLDMAATEWLEEYLKSYRGAFIAVSHDRYFLDAVTDRTFELENRRLKAYGGNYSRYVALKEEEAGSVARRFENQMREIKRVEAIIEQQRRWNQERNYVTAASKQKVVDRLKSELVAPERPPEEIRFNFRTKPGGANDVLIAQGLCKAFGEKPLFEGLNLHIRRGDVAAMIGPNGCGKSTLLRIITGRDKAQAGTARMGAGITAAYYDQSQAGLSPEKTVLREVWDAHPALTETQVRGALAWFLFKGDDIYKRVDVLSGGERARVALLKIALSDTNFLILDEPTNHLDIKSREMLERALGAYEGTMLVVSHDRYFVNRLATRVLAFEDGTLTSTNGNYTQYLRARQLRMQAAGEKADAPKAAAPAQKGERRPQSGRAELRRVAAAVRQAEGDIARAEEDIAGLERELAGCSADYQRLLELTAELEKRRGGLEALYERWHELCAQAERLEGEK